MLQRNKARIMFRSNTPTRIKTVFSCAELSVAEHTNTNEHRSTRVSQNTWTPLRMLWSSQSQSVSRTSPSNHVVTACVTIRACLHACSGWVGSAPLITSPYVCGASWRVCPSPGGPLHSDACVYSSIINPNASCVSSFRAFHFSASGRLTYSPSSYQSMCGFVYVSIVQSSAAY